MKFDEALMRIRSTEEFQIIMDEAVKQRPFLMPMKPGSDYEAEAGRLMYESGEINGFDRLYVFLRGKL